MTKRNLMPRALAALVLLALPILSPQPAEARYTGTGPACVSGVDELSIHSQKSRRSGIVGYLAGGQCGMNIEAVDGAWTYVRGSDKGRNVQGWVRNRFLRAKAGQDQQDADNEENNVASARSCRQFGKIRSRDSRIPVSIRFTNRTGGSRSVMWLDYQGQPKEYKTLAPGQSYVQQTFAGHPWMFTDGPGNCKELLVPGPNTTRYDIRFDR